MRIDQIGEKCTGCGACCAICPTKAITMKIDEEGFEYPVVEEEKCIHCGKCYEKCHVIKKEAVSFVQQAYYGKCKKEEILKLSSSGGMYYTIVKPLQDQGYLIYGAVLEKKDWKVIHQSNQKSDLKEQLGSKYVQSSTWEAFQEIQELLKQNKKIVFSGTPCQVSGLKTMVGQHANLITIDLICHGVPSPKVLQDKVKWLEEKNHSKLVNLKFRSKIGKWSQHKLYSEYENKKIVVTSSDNDEYFNLFLKNYDLRKCCYECEYSNEQHRADITIADYWGILKNAPEENDETGTSLLLINTERGKEMLEKVKDDLAIKPLEWEKACYVYKTHDNYEKQNREQFYKTYKSLGYQEAVQKIKPPKTIYSFLKSKQNWMIYKRISKKLTRENKK